jgi:hypothetical protein
MLCAHTVRRLKPGTFEQFKEGFGPPDEVEAVVSNGVYEIVVTRSSEGAAA